MVGQVVGAIEISNVDLVLMNFKPADRTVVENKPGAHSKGSLSPGKFEDGTHQPHEKSTMTDKRNAMDRLTFLILVTLDQVLQYLIGTRLTFLLRFERAIPPASLIEILRKGQHGKVLRKK